MKKFTKGCLLTALILFLVGIVMCGVCGLLGGFRQLSQMDGIGDFPFGFHMDDDGDWDFGFFRSVDSGGRIGKDWEEERYLRLSEGKENEISMNADSCTELDIELAQCDLYLEEAEDDQIRVYVTGDTLRYYWMMDGSTLCLKNAGKRASHTEDEVHVSIPAGQAFRAVEIEFGAGLLHAAPLQAGEASIDVGAGVCELEELVADEADLTVGAGQLHVETLTAREADVSVGAGELIVRGMTVDGEMDLEMNMGSATLDGKLDGNLSLECGMGDVTMHLTGSEDDHSYDVECGMGDVQVGSHGHGGFATSKSWNDGKGSLFEIDCNMGSVTITFDE